MIYINRLKGHLRLIFSNITDTSNESIYEPLEFIKSVSTTTLRAETKVFIRFEDIKLFEEQGLIEEIPLDENLFT